MNKMYFEKLEVASMLKVTLGTIDNYMKRGDLVFVKLPCGSVRIPADSLDSLIARSTKNSDKKGQVK